MKRNAVKVFGMMLALGLSVGQAAAAISNDIDFSAVEAAANNGISKGTPIAVGVFAFMLLMGIAFGIARRGKR